MLGEGPSHVHPWKFSQHLLESVRLLWRCVNSHVAALDSCKVATQGVLLMLEAVPFL